jgi:hypothetical protein
MAGEIVQTYASLQAQKYRTYFLAVMMISWLVAALIKVIMIM